MIVVDAEKKEVVAGDVVDVNPEVNALHVSLI
jgi:hypothetical protein